MAKHIPVLKKEVVELLKVGKNKNYIDCTFCQGGHSLEILRRERERR
jgi:16S rRNA (cytosine1402-N4)-methyltransferase